MPKCIHAPMIAGARCAPAVRRSRRCRAAPWMFWMVSLLVGHDDTPCASAESGHRTWRPCRPGAGRGTPSNLPGGRTGPQLSRVTARWGRVREDLEIGQLICDACVPGRTAWVFHTRRGLHWWQPWHSTRWRPEPVWPKVDVSTADDEVDDVSGDVDSRLVRSMPVKIGDRGSENTEQQYHPLLRSFALRRTCQRAARIQTDVMLKLVYSTTSAAPGLVTAKHVGTELVSIVDDRCADSIGKTQCKKPLVVNESRSVADRISSRTGDECTRR